MLASWTIQIDWEQDGTFDTDLDDVTAYVMSADWSLGIKDMWQRIGQEPVATLTLKNTDGRFSPKNPHSPIYPNVRTNRPIQITATTASGDAVMYTGVVSAILPNVDPAGEYTGRTDVTIRAEGLKRILDDLDAELQLYTNTRIDAILDDVMAQADASYTKDFDTALTTLDYYGDQQATKAMQVIQELVETEPGHFWFGRDGKVYFRNRHWLVGLGTPTNNVDLASEDPATRLGDPNYTYAEDITNIVRIQIDQREVSGSPVTLWQLQNSITVPAGDSLTFEAKYRRDTGEFVGGSSVSAANTSFSAGTASISVTNRGNRATVTLNNVGAVDAVLTAMDLEGNSINNRNQITFESLDQTSIDEFGKKSKTFTIVGLTGLEDARQRANFELLRRKDPNDFVRSFTLTNSADGVKNTNQVDWGIGTTLRVIADALDHDAEYMIIGEAHELSDALKVHKTTFFLTPGSQFDTFWVLGESELENETILLF